MGGLLELTNHVEVAATQRQKDIHHAVTPKRSDRPTDRPLEDTLETGDFSHTQTRVRACVSACSTVIFRHINVVHCGLGRPLGRPASYPERRATQSVLPVRTRCREQIFAKPKVDEARMLLHTCVRVEWVAGRWVGG